MLAGTAVFDLPSRIFLERVPPLTALTDNVRPKPRLLEVPIEALATMYCV
jgi:hypothetical protein